MSDVTHILESRIWLSHIVEYMVESRGTYRVGLSYKAVVVKSYPSMTNTHIYFWGMLARTQTYPCARTRGHTRARTRTPTHMPTRSHVHTHTRAHTFARARTHTHTNTRTHAHAHTKHTHKHTHTQGLREGRRALKQANWASLLFSTTPITGAFSKLPVNLETKKLEKKPH